jgi:hypothetical protein
VARRGATLAAGLLLLAVTVALAAPHFTKRALYLGRTCNQTSGLPAGAGCVLHFQASRTGATLRFTGDTAVSTWRCKGGGGEALIGGELVINGKLVHGTLVPQLTVKPDRTIYGSTGSGSKRVYVTGHLGFAGKSATILFHSGGPYDCVLPVITLKER